MSSTNRGSQRHPDDFYVTPDWAVEAIVKELPYFETVLEPAAGDGAIMKVLAREYNATLVQPAVPLIARRLQGMEIDEERAALCNKDGLSVQQGDFLKFPWAAGRFDLIITNPPFSLAMDFLKQALWLAGRKGHVCMLLRLAWMASATRMPFHRAYPSDAYVLNKRPSFCSSFKCSCDKTLKWTLEAGAPTPPCPRAGDGAKHKVTRTDTDSSDYAWFLYGPECQGRWKVL